MGGFAGFDRVLRRVGFWNEVVVTHTLEHQEARRVRPCVRDQMRASGADESPGLTDSKFGVFVRELQCDSDATAQNIERVLDV